MSPATATVDSTAVTSMAVWTWMVAALMSSPRSLIDFRRILGILEAGETTKCVVVCTPCTGSCGCGFFLSFSCCYHWLPRATMADEAMQQG